MCPDQEGEVNMSDLADPVIQTILTSRRKKRANAQNFRQVCFAGCRLKFNYNWKTAGHCQTGRSDGRRAYSNQPISSLQWIVSFEETSEISSEIAAEFGFFPVNTEMKAQWACANIFRRLKSYIISFLYLYLAIFCSWPKTRAKSGIDETICGATIQSFTGISLLSACRSITTYHGSNQKSIT